MYLTHLYFLTLSIALRQDDAPSLDHIMIDQDFIHLIEHNSSVRAMLEQNDNPQIQGFLKDHPLLSEHAGKELNSQLVNQWKTENLAPLPKDGRYKPFKDVVQGGRLSHPFPPTPIPVQELDSSAAEETCEAAVELYRSLPGLFQPSSKDVQVNDSSHSKSGGIQVSTTRPRSHRLQDAFELAESFATTHSHRMISQYVLSMIPSSDVDLQNKSIELRGMFQNTGPSRNDSGQQNDTQANPSMYVPRITSDSMQIRDIDTLYQQYASSTHNEYLNSHQRPWKEFNTDDDSALASLCNFTFHPLPSTTFEDCVTTWHALKQHLRKCQRQNALFDRGALFRDSEEYSKYCPSDDASMSNEGIELACDHIVERSKLDLNEKYCSKQLTTIFKLCRPPISESLPPQLTCHDLDSEFLELAVCQFEVTYHPKVPPEIKDEVNDATSQDSVIVKYEVGLASQALCQDLLIPAIIDVLTQGYREENGSLQRNHVANAPSLLKALRHDTLQRLCTPDEEAMNSDLVQTQLARILDAERYLKEAQSDTEDQLRAMDRLRRRARRHRQKVISLDAQSVRTLHQLMSILNHFIADFEKATQEYEMNRKMNQGDSIPPNPRDRPFEPATEPMIPLGIRKDIYYEAIIPLSRWISQQEAESSDDTSINNFLPDESLSTRPITFPFEELALVEDIITTKQKRLTALVAPLAILATVLSPQTNGQYQWGAEGLLFNVASDGYTAVDINHLRTISWNIRTVIDEYREYNNEFAGIMVRATLWQDILRPALNTDAQTYKTLKDVTRISHEIAQGLIRQAMGNNATDTSGNKTSISELSKSNTDMQEAIMKNFSKATKIQPHRP